MTHEEYVKRVNKLEDELDKTMDEFVESNKIYNVGDYLRVSFKKCNGEHVERTCRIMNIYSAPGHSDLMSFRRYPKGELEYFARYAWKKGDEVITGDVCYLGPLSHYDNVCGYVGINWDEVKIEVIGEDELEKSRW